jgi:hypothetical protein
LCALHGPIRQVFWKPRGSSDAAFDIRCVMRDDRGVRTTLDLDEDVLQAAKELAATRGTTAGRVLSDLARQALTPGGQTRMRNGVPVLKPRPRGAPKPTLKQVNELRDPV